MKYYIKNFLLVPHSLTRSQQRGIKLDILNLILQFGEEKYSKGAYVYFISNNKIKSLVKGRLIHPQQSEEINNITVIVKNGTILTTYRKNCRYKISKKFTQKRYQNKRAGGSHV